MTRTQILAAISTHLPPALRDRTLSRISGTLAELDALPPYPPESPFQGVLSEQVYPFLAAAQALDMEGQPTEVIEELVAELLPQSAALPALTWGYWADLPLDLTEGQRAQED